MPSYRLGQDLDVDCLWGILIVATVWEFNELRATSIRGINTFIFDPKVPFSHKPDDVELLHMAHRTHVSSWLAVSYNWFSTRIAPLSPEDGKMIGAPAFAAIMKARSKIRERRLALITPQTAPGWVAGWFYHGTCWAALCDGWKKILDDQLAVRPRIALLEELCSQRTSTTKGRKLCDSCFQKAERGKLRDWLKLHQDMKIAGDALMAALGRDVDRWWDHV